ncbi:hypothetical protein Cni_G22478 [Canna indica]|uniref:ENTH domain-containing protein n=1 Tax=Canna indica TaxID=4628 RepID=A0AAQ3QIA4_9LILI|nr:hypothetical protein Cni_G22478 [Canna indica]
MPSILRQAIGAIKDQTSISLAKISKHSSSLEVAVLKATSHDVAPTEDGHLAEVLLLSSTSPAAAVACAHALSRRIARTSNWVVALKSLLVVFHLVRQGSTRFIHEALIGPPGSRRLLDLSGFRDHSAAANSWDYTSYVRTFAIYVDARLESSVGGKLRNLGWRPVTASTIFANMKTQLILDHIEQWQWLLDRAIGTRPTGPAKFDRIVQFSLYFVVSETFILYRDISHGLSLLLCNFFHLQHESWLKTLDICMKARKQFEELESFYDLCKKIGIARTSEYPCVQRISEPLLKTVEEFFMNRPSSLAASPNALANSPPKLITSSKLQQEFLKAPESKMLRARRRSMGGPTMHDWASVSSSEHKDWQFQVIPSDVDHKCMLKRQKSSSESNLDEWEILLAGSISDMSNEKSYDSAQSRNASPSDAVGLANQHENLQNPFLHINEERSLVLIPPTFSAKKSNIEEVANQVEEDPFAASFQDWTSSAPTQTSDEQQLILYEQHMWMQQQRKIIEKRLTC